MRNFYSQLNKFALVFALLIAGINIQAQDMEMAVEDTSSSKSFKEDWSLGINFGSSIFYGDLRVYKFYPVSSYYNERNAAAGLIVSKKLGDVISLHGRVITGKLSGALRSPDNVYFTSDFFEYTLGGKVNLSNLFSGDYERKLDVNFIAEGGMFKFRSAKYDLVSRNYISSFGYDNQGQDKADRTTEGLLAFGIGLDYKLNESFTISGEITARGVNTDKLDCTIDDSNLPDAYQYSSLGLVYTFGKGTKKKRAEEMAELLAAEEADTIDYAKENYETLEIVKKKVNKLNKKVSTLQETVDDYKDALEEYKETLEEIRNNTAPKVDTSTQKIIVLPDTNNDGVIYYVQVAASYKKVARASYFKAKYKITQDIKEKKVDNWYKYYVGRFTDINEAIVLKDEIKANGCEGAFVVATYNGKIVSINQARSLSK